MAYYVPLGIRGLILRIGAWLTGILGASVYWSATWRRGRLASAPAPHFRDTRSRSEGRAIGSRPVLGVVEDVRNRRGGRSHRTA